MFKIQPNPTFWTSVDIPVAGGEPMPIEIEFRHKRKSEAVEFGTRMRSGGMRDIDALREVVAGWRGADVEFSDQALVDLDENHAGAVGAILGAYPGALAGARRKN